MGRDPAGFDEFYVARLYRALTDEALRVPVDPPALVRARAERQARARATLAVSTVFVLVVGVSTASGVVVRHYETTVVVPSPQVTVPSVPPSPSPAVTQRLAEGRGEAG